MKFSPALLLAVAVAEDKKVPPRHPLQRLARLTEFTEQLMTDWFGKFVARDAWIAKFANNAARMERNFKRGSQRCGHYDAQQLPHGGPERKRREAAVDVERFNLMDPKIAVTQLTTGYRKWAERYLSQCSGQRQYQLQVNRMNKWNDLLIKHLSIPQQFAPGPESTLQIVIHIQTLGNEELAIYLDNHPQYAQYAHHGKDA